MGDDACFIVAVPRYGGDELDNLSADALKELSAHYARFLCVLSIPD